MLSRDFPHIERPGMGRDINLIYTIDDDPSVLKSLGRLLRSEGFSVKAFSSAEEFLKNFPDKKSSCLILDIRMPGIDGLALQDKLLEMGLNLPIIFITGHGDASIREKVMQKGAAAFLLKPFDKSDLFKALENIRRNMG